MDWLAGVTCFVIASGLVYFFYDIVIKGNSNGVGIDSTSDCSGGMPVDIPDISSGSDGDI